MTAYPPPAALSIKATTTSHSTGKAAARSKARDRLAWAAARLPSVLFAIVFGGLLFGLALPRLFAGTAVPPFEDRLAHLAQPGAVLAADARSLVGALRVVESGRGWAALGELYLERARRLTADPETRDAYLDRGIAALSRGVALAPAQPIAWTMLAQALLARYGAAAEIGRPLRMAIRTAPRQENLLLPRIDAGLLAWPRLDAELRRLIGVQIALAVDLAPGELALLARERYALARMRRLLARDPTRLRRFDTAYLSLN